MSEAVSDTAQQETATIYCQDSSVNMFAQYAARGTDPDVVDHSVFALSGMVLNNLLSSDKLKEFSQSAAQLTKNLHEQNRREAIVTMAELIKMRKESPTTKETIDHSDDIQKFIMSLKDNASYDRYRRALTLTSGIEESNAPLSQHLFEKASKWKNIPPLSEWLVTNTDRREMKRIIDLYTCNITDRYTRQTLESQLMLQTKNLYPQIRIKAIEIAMQYWKEKQWKDSWYTDMEHDPDLAEFFGSMHENDDFLAYLRKLYDYSPDVKTKTFSYSKEIQARAYAQRREQEIIEKNTLHLTGSHKVIAQRMLSDLLLDIYIKNGINYHLLFGDIEQDTAFRKFISALRHNAVFEDYMLNITTLASSKKQTFEDRIRHKVIEGHNAHRLHTSGILSKEYLAERRREYQSLRLNQMLSTVDYFLHTVNQKFEKQYDPFIREFCDIIYEMTTNPNQYKNVYYQILEDPHKLDVLNYVSLSYGISIDMVKSSNRKISFMTISYPGKMRWKRGEVVIPLNMKTKISPYPEKPHRSHFTEQKQEEVFYNLQKSMPTNSGVFASSMAA